MTATKYAGVQYHDAKDGTRTYYIRYKFNGVLKRQKVGTKAEGITPQYCKKFRDETLVKLRLGESAPVQSRNSVKTLDEVATEYFDQSEAKSIYKTESVYNTHLTHLKDNPITAIDDDMVAALKRKKIKEVSPKTKRVLSAKTVNNILSVLSAILHYARKKKYLKSLPLIEKVKKIDNTRERFLSTEEINLLMQKIKDSRLPTTERLLLFVRLSLVTGGRMGSILTIQGKDIDRKNKLVRLQNHKTGKSYTGYLSDEILADIPPLKPQEYLIDVSDGKQVQRPLQSLLDTLFNQGLKPEDRKERVVVHTLRHTFASHLAINGTPIQTIMKLMDHSDIKMTLRYAKLMPDAGRDQVVGLYQ